MSLTDPTAFDFYNNLIDGPTKKESEGWTPIISISVRPPSTIGSVWK